MRRVNYNNRPFSKLSTIYLEKASNSEIETYLEKIAQRIEDFENELTILERSFSLSKTVLNSGKGRNKIEIVGALAATGFYLADPTGMTTVAFGIFAIPVLITTKIMDRKPAKEAKAMLKDIIALENEVSTLKTMQHEASKVLKTRNKPQ